MALLIGLFHIAQSQQSDDKVHVISDSQLLVKQVNREYKVRNPELMKLHELAISMIQKTHAVVMHVLRTDNHVADAMANHGIDEKIPLPKEFIALLARENITL